MKIQDIETFLVNIGGQNRVHAGGVDVDAASRHGVYVANVPSGETANADSVADAASRVQDQAKRYGQRAMDAVESSRESAASTLDSAASGIRSKADSLPGGADVVLFEPDREDA